MKCVRYYSCPPCSQITPWTFRERCELQQRFWRKFNGCSLLNGLLAHTGRGVNKNKAVLVVLTWNSFLSPGMCKIMSLQRCPCPNPQNLWICYITQQRGITVANQLTLKMGSYCISTISQF